MPLLHTGAAESGGGGGRGGLPAIAVCVCVRVCVCVCARACVLSVRLGRGLAESLWGMGGPSSPTSVTYLTGKRRYCAKFVLQSPQITPSH